MYSDFDICSPGYMHGGYGILCYVMLLNERD